MMTVALVVVLWVFLLEVILIVYGFVQRKNLEQDEAHRKEATSKNERNVL